MIMRDLYSPAAAEMRQRPVGQDGIGQTFIEGGA